MARQQIQKRLLLGQFLKECREAAQLRQIDVEKKLRKPAGWMQRIEAGVQYLDVLDFIDLSRVLHFDPGRCVREVIA